MRKAIITALVLVLFTITGCRPLFTKLYCDYPNVWMSEDGKVALDPSGAATVQYDESNSSWEIRAGSDSGMRTLWFTYDDPNAVGNSNLIWKAYAEIKQDVLYLTIDQDYYTGLVGKTIVLKQSDIPSILASLEASE